MDRKMKIICSVCGFESEDDSIQYCPICGKKFEEVDHAAAEEARTPVHEEDVIEPISGSVHVAAAGSISQRRKGPTIPVLIILCAAVGIGAFALGRGSGNKLSVQETEESMQASSSVVTAAPSAEKTSTSTSTVKITPTVTPTPTAALTPTVTPTPTEVPESEHLYYFYLEDCTWSEAFESAVRKGGHLVTIETEEEYQKIVKQAEAEGYKGNEHFYIGGMRVSDSYSYYWADKNKKLFGEPINSISGELNAYWLKGEPTFTSGADSDVFYDETVLMLLRFEDTGEWVLNDIPDDILEVAPYYSGKLGYICEFEG